MVTKFDEPRLYVVSQLRGFATPWLRDSVAPRLI